MEVYSPATLNEALSILSEKRDGLYVLSGGTDLVIKIKERVIRPDALLDLSRIEELHFIRDEGNLIKIGSLTKIGELLDSSLIKDFARPLWEAAHVFGSPQIRNLATIG